jgi:hypothetical protein
MQRINLLNLVLGLLTVVVFTACDPGTSNKGDPSAKAYENTLDQMRAEPATEKKLLILSKTSERLENDSDFKSCGQLLVGECANFNRMQAVMDEIPSAIEFKKSDCETYRKNLRQQFNPTGKDDPEELTMGFLMLDELCS